MKKKISLSALFILVIIVISFLAGFWLNNSRNNVSANRERKVLYYVDPMNPAYKSEKPGIAPCGMSLEPVYADKNDSLANNISSSASLPAGTIAISPEKQQIIGVKLMTVEKAPWSYTLRVLGRVTPDETRIYRINAATNGWIMNAPPLTTGSLVKKDDLLATFSFFSAEFRSALQAYLNIMNAGNADLSTSDTATGNRIGKIKDQRSKEYESIRLTGRSDLYSQGDYYKQNIINYGITETQLKEIERNRKIPDAIDIRSPASGFLLFRNVSPGLRFDRGTELFRVVNLTKVWILADVFENEISFFKPGMRVKMELPYQKKTLFAQISSVLPQFDPATRTLKVRLEADNPGYFLRPDMFVNVELPLTGPPAIIVPLDAVLDSGVKKTVFVDRGNGFFEPRQVETGRMLGERVEIIRGVMPGEKIVVSGNFLLDSETRLRQATAGIPGKTGRDPVCGMNIDEDHSRSAGYRQEYLGKTYLFCSTQCRDDFIKAPQRYTKSAAAQGNIPLSSNQTIAPKIKHQTSNDVPKHSAHDHTTMHNAQDNLPMPIQSNMKMIAPENKKAGMSNNALMPGAKTSPLFPSATGSPMPMMPGPGRDMIQPGVPGNMPLPNVKTDEKFSPALPQRPSANIVPLQPGSPGESVMPESAGNVRKTSRPARRSGIEPSGGAFMPATREAPSLSQPKSNETIAPGTPSPVTNGQINPAGGE